MNSEWLWDRRISKEEVLRILNNEQDKRFVEIAALLFSRKNSPKEVFGEYINEINFVRNWQRIKRVMRKNSWNDQRIIFWSSVYAYLVEDYRKKGMSIHKTTMKKPVNDLCVKVGEQIKTVRKQNRLTQADLSKKIGISQQMISRIEKGQENLSILTLNAVTAGLGKTVVLNLK